MYSSAKIQDVLISCAEECILPYHNNLKEDDIKTKTSDVDLVTIADTKAETFLNTALCDLIPNSVLLGEEGFGDDPNLMKKISHEKDVWIIDSIDGTGNFKIGNDNFAIHVTHAHEGILVGAWIYAPKLQKFAAWKQDENVTLNDKPVVFDTKAHALDSLIVGEHIAWCYPEDKTQLKKNANTFFSQTISRHCIGIETLMMLENEIDALTFGKGNPWDMAPCTAFINALGGKVCKIDGSKIEKETLFSIKGPYLAVRCAEQWEEIRNLMLHDISWEKYFV